MSVVFLQGLHDPMILGTVVGGTCGLHVTQLFRLVWNPSQNTSRGAHSKRVTRRKRCCAFPKDKQHTLQTHKSERHLSEYIVNNLEEQKK